jgi:hypothetical protein
MWQHMYNSGLAIVRSFIMFRPNVIFVTLGVLLFIGGLIPFIRYGVLYLSNDRGDHIQSLLLGAVLLFASIIAFALAVIADLIRTNRILQEDSLERIKSIQFDNNRQKSD